MFTWDWNPLTVVATAAASLCRRRLVLNWPFTDGPSWQWMREEEGGENMGWGRERAGYGRMKDNQIRETGEFLTEVDFSQFLALNRAQRGIQAVRKVHHSHRRSPKHVSLFVKYNPHPKRRWKGMNWGIAWNFKVKQICILFYSCNVMLYEVKGIQ